MSIVSTDSTCLQDFYKISMTSTAFYDIYDLYGIFQSLLMGCSPPNTLVPTRKSFSMTSQLETRSEGDRTSCSPISTASIASAKQSPMQTELSIRAMGVKCHPKEGTNLGKEKGPRRISATVSMERQDVISSRTSAITSISAEGVGKEDMVSIHAQKSSKETVHGMRPKYLHHNIWDPDSDFSPNTADWTLTAKPLEGPLEQSGVTYRSHALVDRFCRRWRLLL